MSTRPVLAKSLLFASFSGLSLLFASFSYGQTVWTGATNDANLGTNWSTGTPTVTVDTQFGATGVNNPTQTAALIAKSITFNLGAQAYTYTSTGQTLETGGLTSAPAVINNSANQQVLNTGDFGLTGLVQAAAGDIVINGAVNVGNNSTNGQAYIEFKGSHNIYLNVDTTINPAGNVAGGAWTSAAITNSTAYTNARGRLYMTNLSGRVYLGDLGTAWKGVINMDSIEGGKLRLTNNNSMGLQGVGINSALVIGGDSTGNGLNQGNGTVELVNNISTGRGRLYLNGRVGSNANTPHISNISGNNTLTFTDSWITGDPQTGSVPARAGNWNINSDSGTLTIAGGDIYNTNNVATNLQLMGAGNGVISAPIQKRSTFPTLQITKTGAGTWTLTNSNAAGATVSTLGTAFDGTTTIQQGTLALSGAGSLANSSSIDVRSGAFLDVSGVTGGVYTLNSSNLTLKGAGTVTGSLTAGTSNSIAPGDSGVGTLTITNPLSLTALSLTGGSTLQFDLVGTPAGASDRITLNGNLSLANSTTVNVTATNGNLGNGTYTLMTYTGSLTGDATNNLSLTGTPSSQRQFFELKSNIANQINLVVTGSAADLTWVGGVNSDIWVDGVADTNSLNWSGSVGDKHFYNGDNVTFGAAGTTTVSVSGTVNPGNVTFSNGSGHDDTVNGGNINVAGAVAFSGAGDVTFLNSDVTSVGTVTKSGSGKVTFSNTGLLTMPTIALNSGSIVINRSSDTTLASAISGAGALRHEAASALTLSGNNSGFTGTIAVTTGTLKAGSANALGGSTVVTTVSNGASLDLNGSVLVNGTASIVGTGFSGQGALFSSVGSSTAEVSQIPKVILSGDATIGNASNARFNIGKTGGGASFQGNGFNLDVVTTAAGEIDVIDVGNMNLNNLNINSGTLLYIAGNTILGPATGTVTLQNNGRLAFYGTGENNAALSSTGVIDKPIVVGAGNTGEIEVFRGHKTIDSPIAMDGNLSVEIYARSDNTFITTLTGPLTGTGSLAVHTSSNGVARFGLVALTNNGNTFAGTTTIGGGGGFVGATTTTDRVGLAIGNGGATGSIGPGDISLNPAAAGTGTTFFYLNRTGTYSLVNNIIMGGNANTATIDSIAAGNATLSGVISGAGRVAVDAGNLTLSGNSNSYAGTTTVNGGVLTVNGTHTGGADYTIVGGTLAGNGTIGSTVNLQTAGHIAPGNSVGALHLSSNLTNTDGVYDWQLGALKDQATGVAGTDFDQLAVGGDLALSGATSVALDFSLLTLGLQPGGGNAFWNSSHTWKIVDTTTNSGSTNFSSVTTAAPGTWTVTLGTGADLGDVFLNYALAAALTGDVNNDHIVNQLDLNVVFGNWLSTGATLAQGDANHDGVINQLDINTITGNWLATGPASGFGATSVPEPSSLLLCGLGILSLVRSRRRLSARQVAG